MKKPPDISIIVPALNEAKQLPAFLAWTNNWPVKEVIVVDGGSHDTSSSILLDWVSAIPSKGQYRLLAAPKGRGSQMNEGARAATGEILLFLHADSTLPLPPPDWVHEIQNAFLRKEIVGGAFRLSIDSPSLFLKWVSKMANVRSLLLGLPYGDQGIFVRREIFEQLGGFPNEPLMEDVMFIQRLKNRGKIVLLDCVIKTSARRWEKHPVWTSLRNLLLLGLYFMGVSPSRLAKWYH